MADFIEIRIERDDYPFRTSTHMVLVKSDRTDRLFCKEGWWSINPRNGEKGNFLEGKEVSKAVTEMIEEALEG